MSKREKIVTRWDVHEASAPYESDRWASSDRGWLFADITPAPMSINVTGATYVTLGHYLDYTRGDGKSVHAVSCCSRNSAYFATPAEARAWIEGEAKGRIPSHFASVHQGYEHRKEEIRRMIVQSVGERGVW